MITKTQYLKSCFAALNFRQKSQDTFAKPKDLLIDST